MAVTKITGLIHITILFKCVSYYSEVAGSQIAVYCNECFSESLTKYISTCVLCSCDATSATEHKKTEVL